MVVKHGLTAFLFLSMFPLYCEKRAVVIEFPVIKKEWIMNKIKNLLFSEAFRYLVVGGLTTLVNLAVFALLTEVLHWNVTLSNVISIFTSILFAYVTNKIFVFRSHCATFGALIIECAKFIGARLATMAIEVGGVFLTVNIIGQQPMIGKLETQVIVIIGNYFISKFFVFKREE